MSRRLNWITAVLIVLLLGGYVVAYLALSDYSTFSTWANTTEGFRAFGPSWVPLPLYWPLAKVESVIRGHEVVLLLEENFYQ